MKNDKVKETLLFAVAGLLGYMVDVLVTIMLNELVNPYIARIPGFVAAATATWLFNRNYTFGVNKSKYASLWKEYLHYVGLMTIGLMVNYGIYVLAVTMLPTSIYKIPLSVALGSLAGMTVNYINSKKYIFNQNSKK